MCRFLVYQGPPIQISKLITEPENSLIHQSVHSHEREEPLNGDGFGVAWWVPTLHDGPAVFRSLTPAWSNENLRSLAASIETRAVMAHVRAASESSMVSEANTHPFRWRQFAFMHNGDVGGFGKVRRPLRRALSDDAYNLICGTTDSEDLFAVFADHWLTGQEDDPSAEPVEAMARALHRTLEHMAKLRDDAGVEERSYFNLAVSDGVQSVVCRYTDDEPENAESLHLHTGHTYVCEEGMCRMLPVGEGDDVAVIVSSEALSEDPGWHRVAGNHLVTIRPDGRVSQRRIAIG